ncbi:MAG: adenylate/guanylate cyclase domain-containing protein, partial [Verrucomicrobiota bacterium]
DRAETVVRDEYDPRIRPWYLIATEQEAITPTIHWTEPYTFFTTQLPGITASIRIHDARGRTGVLSLDIYLEDVTRLTGSIEVSPNGFVVVTTSDVSTIGLPRHPELATSEARLAGFLKHPRDLGIPLLAEGARQIQDRFKIPDGEVMSADFGGSENNRPFRWRFEGAPWWTYFRPFRMEDGPELWMGVAVPEDDFLSELKEGRLYSVALACGALLLAAFLSIRLSRRYSTAISTLIRQSERLRILDTTQSEENLTEIREIAQLHDAHERMRLALDSFARYVPSDVVRDLLVRGEAAVIGGRNTQLSILFTDIEGFTSIAENMDPSDLTEHMATYFDALIGVITKEHGTVDKIIGDAIVAFWSAPKPNPHHARDSVRAAWRCCQTLAPMNSTWETEGLPRLPTRFGISTGDVVVGNVGASNRLSYTAIGDAMNLASRLESANKYYGTRILASQATVDAAGEEFAWRRIDRVRVKGRMEPEMIYELLGEWTEVSEETVTRARSYESAFNAYLGREFPQADGILTALPKELDHAERRLLGLCRQAQEAPPADDWDGASELREK